MYKNLVLNINVYLLIGTMRWSQPLLQGPSPIPRFGQTMTRVGSKVVIFGGSTGVSNAHTNDHIVVLDLGTLFFFPAFPLEFPSLSLEFTRTTTSSLILSCSLRLLFSFPPSFLLAGRLA
jgi:hypothetical protein